MGEACRGLWSSCLDEGVWWRADSWSRSEERCRRQDEGVFMTSKMIVVALVGH